MLQIPHHVSSGYKILLNNCRSISIMTQSRCLMRNDNNHTISELSDISSKTPNFLRFISSRTINIGRHTAIQILKIYHIDEKRNSSMRRPTSFFISLLIPLLCDSYCWIICALMASASFLISLLTSCLISSPASRTTCVKHVSW